jgi:hypothetical protein
VTPNPANISADGLRDAICTCTATLRDSDNADERRSAARWLGRYADELTRRARDAERPAFLTRRTA